MRRVNLTVIACVLPWLLNCEQHPISNHPVSGARPSSFERRKQCAEAGWTFFGREKAEAESPKYRVAGVLSTIGDPRFAHDPIKDTCYCEHEDTAFIQTPTGQRLMRTGYLYDIFSNELVADYGVLEEHGTLVQSTGTLTEEQFKAKRKQLMGF